MPNNSPSIEAAIPSVDVLLRHPDAARLIDGYGRPAVLDAIRMVLATIRRDLPQQGEQGLENTGEEAIIERAASVLRALMRPSLNAVFNLTGTILHTNLGRARLADEAVAAMVAAAGACTIEYDLDAGRRGDRDWHLESWLCRLTGGEAATAVNNNAAAVLLTLNTLALRKEVVVSRGELIEIGGSFRIPEIMNRAGCKLREVGATNRTHLGDFENAISSKTAMIMKVHASNYQINGFTAETPTTDLADLAAKHEIPLVVDLGSGTLLDLERYGLPHEPTPRETLAAGADLVTFSGDKLLGGPQAGLIVGRADLIEKIKKNPMKRAMRLDKVTIAALAATLRLYEDPDRLAERLPTLRLLTRTVADIEAQARRLETSVAEALDGKAVVSVQPCRSQIGSGSMPVDLLDSYCLAIRPTAVGRGEKAALKRLVGGFRGLPVPVIGRLGEAALLLDCRALEDEAGFVAQLGELIVEVTI